MIEYANCKAELRTNLYWEKERPDVVKDVVGKGEFVGGAGDGDEVREAQEGDEHQHGLRRFPILLNSNHFNYIRFHVWLSHFDSNRIFWESE